MGFRIEMVILKQDVNQYALAFVPHSPKRRYKIICLPEFCAPFTPVYKPGDMFCFDISVNSRFDNPSSTHKNGRLSIPGGRRLVLFRLFLVSSSSGEIQLFPLVYQLLTFVDYFVKIHSRRRNPAKNCEQVEDAIGREWPQFVIDSVGRETKLSAYRRQFTEFLAQSAGSVIAAHDVAGRLHHQQHFNHL